MITEGPIVSATVPEVCAFRQLKVSQIKHVCDIAGGGTAGAGLHKLAPGLSIKRVGCWHSSSASDWEVDSGWVGEVGRKWNWVGPRVTVVFATESYACFGLGSVTWDCFSFHQQIVSGE